MDIVTESLIIDDLERERTKAIRTLREQKDLLSDALHALRNGSPAVTEEFLERSIAAIAKAIP